MEDFTISTENKSKSVIENEFENLSISNQSESYLLSTAKWAKFLAVLGFIGIGIMIIAGGFITGISGILGEYQTSPVFASSAGTVFIGLIYVIGAILYFFPTYYLFHFASKTKQAIENKNSVMLEEGFRNMKRYAKFVGILMIVVIGLYPIAILMFVIGDFLNSGVAI